ncbi:IS6 family transposase [Sulfitobacter pacificus]|uniref:IS6 family transposase n=1 Tax=Sulfitobacter pacificus TaxID=1499314 RepID=A0ABQ5VQ42_9RHOB|nr:IS6 family transposase [Sulfitobacter pacificus]GLQ29206.1 IS6 family transposase [Sulfitobacter pacificus]
MIFSVQSSALKGYRFPRSVIGYPVWAYHRSALSLRDIEDLLAERGITVSHETIRDWVAKFGTQIAAKIRRDRAKPAEKWHLDEVVITISGTKHWLWRAVDGNGDTLEILVQSRRNARAAKRFLRKLMKRWGAPRVIVTDKLRSYRVATRELCPGVDHRSHKGLNNRSEASHRHTRRREKIFGRFKSARQAQMFLSVHDQTAVLFRPKRHRLSAADYRRKQTEAQGLWVGYVGEIVA